MKDDGSTTRDGEADGTVERTEGKGEKEELGRG